MDTTYVHRKKILVTGGAGFIKSYHKFGSSLIYIKELNILWIKLVNRSRINYIAL